MCGEQQGREVTRALATDQMRRTLAAAGLEYEPGQDAFLRDFAIAAIKAMREPTEHMVKSGHRGFCFGRPLETYQEMIDAALREEGR